MKQLHIPKWFRVTAGHVSNIIFDWLLFFLVS